MQLKARVSPESTGQIDISTEFVAMCNLKKRPGAGAHLHLAQ